MKKSLKIIFTFVLLFTLFGVTKVNASAPARTFDIPSDIIAKKGDKITVYSYLNSGNCLFYGSLGNEFSIDFNNEFLKFESFNSNFDLHYNPETKKITGEFCLDLNVVKPGDLLYWVEYTIRDDAETGLYLIGKLPTLSWAGPVTTIKQYNIYMNILDKNSNIDDFLDNTEDTNDEQTTKPIEESTEPTTPIETESNNTNDNKINGLVIALSSIILVLLITILYLVIKIRKIKNSNLNNN